MKKLALYHPWIYLKGGAERVLLEIANRSNHEVTLFTNYIDYENTFVEFQQLSKIHVLRQVPIKRNFTAVCQAAAVIASQKLNLSNFDALMISSEGLGDFINLRNHSIPSIGKVSTARRS